MARPRRFTATQVARALVDADGVLVDAARALGCSEDTVRRSLARHPEVRRARQEGLAHLVDLAVGTLRQALLGGDARAAQWVLARLGRDLGFADSPPVAAAEATPVILMPAERFESPQEWANWSRPYMERHRERLAARTQGSGAEEDRERPTVEAESRT